MHDRLTWRDWLKVLAIAALYCAASAVAPGCSRDVDSRSYYIGVEQEREFTDRMIACVLEPKNPNEKLLAAQLLVMFEGDRFLQHLLDSDDCEEAIAEWILKYPARAGRDWVAGNARAASAAAPGGM